MVPIAAGVDGWGGGEDEGCNHACVWNQAYLWSGEHYKCLCLGVVLLNLKMGRILLSLHPKGKYPYAIYRSPTSKLIFCPTYIVQRTPTTLV